MEPQQFAGAGKSHRLSVSNGCEYEYAEGGIVTSSTSSLHLFLILPLRAGFLLLGLLNLETSEAWIAFNGGLLPDRFTVEHLPTDYRLSPCRYEPIFRKGQ
jgi:hypothetical protein